MTIEQLLHLPWTIKVEKRSDDGDYWSASITELPGFVVAADSKAALDADFWPALREHLCSYLDSGDEVPLPTDDRFHRVWVQYEVVAEDHRREIKETQATPSVPPGLTEVSSSKGDAVSSGGRSPFVYEPA